MTSRLLAKRICLSGATSVPTPLLALLQTATFCLTAAATRIHFKDCFFTFYADADAPLFVSAAGAGDIDREILFENCTFYNPIGSQSTSQTAAMSVHASAGGDIILKDCMLIGAADWEAADAANIYLMCHTQTDAGGIANMGIGVTLDVTE